MAILNFNPFSKKTHQGYNYIVHGFFKKWGFGIENEIPLFKCTSVCPETAYQNMHRNTFSFASTCTAINMQLSQKVTN